MEFVAASDFGSLSGSTVAWSNLSSLDPGQTKTLTISLRIVDAAQAPYINFAEITDDSSEDYGVTDEDSTPDTDPDNDPIEETDDPNADIAGDEDDSDTEPIDINVVYDLALIKTLSAGQSAVVGVGDIVDYTITIANQGNVPSNTYTVMDQLPAGLGFIAASNNGTVNGSIVTWANLPTDGFGTDPNDLYTNHNDITLDDPAGDEDDNDFEDLTLLPVYDLALVKLLTSEMEVEEGDIVDYSIVVTNQGTVPSNDYVVSDYIPAGMSFVAASDGGVESNGIVTWSTLPSIAPGLVQVVTLSLRMEDASLEGNYRNFAEISDDSAADFGVTDEDSTPDNDPDNDPVINHNDPASDTVAGDEDDHDFEEITPIRPPSLYDLALIKTIAAGEPTSLATGDQVTYNITITNQGDVPSNAYEVTDLR